LGTAKDMVPFLKTKQQINREQINRKGFSEHHDGQEEGGDGLIKNSAAEKFTMICKCCLVGIAPDELTYIIDTPTHTRTHTHNIYV
jgi:hypothetical protein